MAYDETDTEVEQAFRISPEFGVEALHYFCSLSILACIKANGFGLKVQDIDDVYQQTMIEMLLAARKPGFDPVGPVRLAMHIAKQRTKDRRKKWRLTARREGSGYQDLIIEDMKTTQLGVQAKFDPIDWAKFDVALWEKIGTLPPMQNAAAVCFVDVYEDIREQNSYRPLADAMTEYLGKPVSHVAAKSAWHEAHKKLADDLRRRGFNFLSEKDP